MLKAATQIIIARGLIGPDHEVMSGSHAVTLWLGFLDYKAVSQYQGCIKSVKALPVLHLTVTAHF